MRLLLFLARTMFLALSAPASAVNIDWVTVGDPGNACDRQRFGCYGAVATVYRIAKTEVTNAQYAEFLNAKAASDPHGLYNTSYSGLKAIRRSGIPGSYTYMARASRKDEPVNYVSFYDSLRFANWLHNGQGSGDTETGAYTITAGGIADNSITRNAGATIFLTSEDEWYKAAYFNGTSYFDYPTGTDTQIVCAAPGATANTANCGGVVGALTDVASYTGSGSPYGTFDQGGNIWEWNEAILYDIDVPTLRGVRGGGTQGDPTNPVASRRNASHPTWESDQSGFRVASVIPEPGTGLLLMAGVLGLAGCRRRLH